MKVAVIGGGVVGASAALRLVRSGHSVVLVDRADVGQATAASLGIVSPGTVYARTPGDMPDRWLDFAIPASRFYAELFEMLGDGSDADAGYSQSGALVIAMNDAEYQEAESIAQVVSHRHAVGMANVGDPEVLAGETLRRRYPWLSSEVRGAVLVPGVARIDGRRLRDAMVNRASEDGMLSLTGSAELVFAANRVTAVRIENSIHRVDAAVIAGGAWTGRLNGLEQLREHVVPERGEVVHLQTALPGVAASPILMGYVQARYILAMNDSYVVAGASRDSQAGFAVEQDDAAVSEILAEMTRVIPALSHSRVRERRVGLRPITTDRMPVIGVVPALERVFIATGNGHLGLMQGPYTGAAVADLLNGDVPPGLEGCRPDRFWDVP